MWVHCFLGDSMEHSDPVIWVDDDGCSCECEPVVKQHHIHPEHHEKAVVKEVKPHSDVEKVVPVKEAEVVKEPDATIKLTKETTAELDAKDGHITDLSMIKHGAFAEVTSQERDLTTVSITSNEQSVFQQETTVIFRLPPFIVTEQNNCSSAGSSAIYNPIQGTSGADTLIGTFENDLISGFEGNDTLSGRACNDILDGDAGNDILDGGAGNDILYGGAGNDFMFGGLGDDILDGGPDRDFMIGGLGDDIYYVDDPSDLVSESSGQGIDTVFSTISYSINFNLVTLNATLTGLGLPPSAAGNGVENLTALGLDNIFLEGNNLDNIIRGNVGNNVIDGRTGADTMLGGAGNDVYLVDNAGDVVVENPGEGYDQVFTNVSLTLSDNVEAIIGNGGFVGITLTGNSGDNFIGGAQGNDVVVGGLGADIFLFDLKLAGGFGNDVVTDFTKAQNDVLFFRGVIDSGDPGLSIDDLIAMETAPVSHPNGTDTQFTFAAGTVTLVGINVTDFNDILIASSILVQP